jgi:hypothetical protein
MVIFHSYVSLPEGMFDYITMISPFYQGKAPEVRSQASQASHESRRGRAEAISQAEWTAAATHARRDPKVFGLDVFLDHTFW